MTRMVTTEMSPTANAASTPRGVSPTGQRLGVKWVGLLQALSAVKIKKNKKQKESICNMSCNFKTLLWYS